MRLMLHTFAKDARHLWPAVGVSWLMLGVLAHSDRWRADWMSSSMDGWLTLLLSMAWACVAALAVQEEPLVGDRNFWTTRPHRWPALLGAKLLFVLLAIHVPMFVADLYILTSRGFSPASYLSELLAKQLLFFGALTLPALALASVVSNFTHFVLAVFSIAAGIGMLNGSFQGPTFYYSQDAGEVRHALIRVVLALAAIAIVLVQYAKRRALIARVLAVAAALTAGSVSAYMPPRVEYAMRGDSGQAPPRITLRTAAPNERLLRSPRGLPSLADVVIPISVNPTERDGLFHFRDLDLEIATSNGARMRNVRIRPGDPTQKIPFSAFISGNWLLLRFAPAEWDRVKNTPVEIVGSAAVQFYRFGETTTIPTTGWRDVPDVGRCTTSLVEGRVYENVFKLLCESPRDLPATHVTLTHGPSGRESKASLRSGITFEPGPRQTWFSPLQRGQTYFRLTDEISTQPGSQWLFPTEYLPTAQLTITPEIVTGTAIAHFQFTLPRLPVP